LLVWLHRWTGLLMAGFLIVEGVTGSVLAFRESLDRLSAPQLFATSQPGVAPLGLAALARRAEALAPRARVGYFSLEERQVVMHMLPRSPRPSNEPGALGFDRLYLNPWTGEELGRRLDGDISQGWINLVPFIYRVHMNLAAGDAGMWVLGIVALAWTADSFVSLYLTLPLVLARFLVRWKVAWLIKWRAGTVRLNFDLHRASGLWLWPLLFVFGWSSVMFNLNSVYEPVTGALFDYRSGMDDVQMLRLSANPMPRLDWDAAQIAGERLMAIEAVRRGFRIERPYGMAYIQEFGVYTYAVAADVNIQHSGWTTSLWLDGNTGALVKMDLPSGEHAGNTVENWLRALHFADLRDSLVYRVLVCALGIVITLLSVTGLYIWLKKRRSRRFLRTSTLGGLHVTLAKD
jgi:uncharacterized iron-regulated membrane protein